MYETPSGIATIQCAPLTPGVGNNQAVILAISGTRFRVMGWTAQGSTAAMGAILFKSASAGTALTTTMYIQGNANIVIERQDIHEGGYFETLTGEGLYVDVTVAAVNLNVFYITYTPI